MKNHGLEHRRYRDQRGGDTTAGVGGGECGAGQGRRGGWFGGVRGHGRGLRPGLPLVRVFATRLKDYRTTRPRDLSCGGRPVSIRWRKARWYCTEAACERASFTEAIRQVPARMRTSTALRRTAGAAVCDGGRTWCRPAGILDCPGRSCSTASRTTTRLEASTGTRIGSAHRSSSRRWRGGAVA